MAQPDAAPTTIAELVRRGVEAWSDQVLLIHDGVALTWRQVDARSAELAAGLLALGVGRGTRVGLLMPDSSEWIVALLAITRIGALACPMSTFLQARELAVALRSSDVGVLLTVDRFLAHDYLERLERVAGLSGHNGTPLFVRSHPSLRHIAVWGGPAPAWSVGGPDALVELGRRCGIDRDFVAAVESTVRPADLLLTIWTSGTSAEPKGVVHAHGTVLRYLHALAAAGRNQFAVGERSYCAMPFFWLGGLNTQVLPALLSGAVIVTTSRVDAPTILDHLLAADVTKVSGWMRPLQALEQEVRARGIDPGRFRGLGAPPSGPDGSRPPPDQRATAFGMTETFGPHSAEAIGCALPPGKEGSFGRAVAGYERKIIDADGSVLGPGEIGELRVRGDGLMVGYYERERRDTFDSDGFFRTGDRCSIDADGYLYFHGRDNELIKTAGANVSPLEIETLLRTYPEVAEAVVFGIPDVERGASVVAAVVAAPGTAPVPAELIDRMRSDVSHYKVPATVILIEALDVPRTDSGKPRKAALRAALLPELP